MARIRYLKPDFFKDEDLAEHPYWIRLLFAGLWNIADKEGRLEDRIKRIKVDLFPYDNVDIEKGLQELSKPKNGSKKPFIQRYDIDGDKYIQIVNWHKHQKPHGTERDSIIPPAPPLNTKGNGEGNGELTGSQLGVKQPLNNIPLTVKIPNYKEFEELIFTSWNSFCDKNPSLSKIKEITDTRRKHLKERFTKDSFRDFAGILRAIEQQPFLIKGNPNNAEHKDWKVSFDWLIENDTNYMKVLEFRYKNKKEGDIKTADPDCQVCAGTGWDETEGSKKLCRCRLSR
jgi:hypothetical protein